MKYEMLTVEERRSMLLPRIAQAEREVYQAELDRIAQKITGDYLRKTEAENQLEVLNNMLADLDQEENKVKK
jgi:hypothetical protein